MAPSNIQICITELYINDLQGKLYETNAFSDQYVNIKYKQHKNPYFLQKGLLVKISCLMLNVLSFNSISVAAPNVYWL